VLTIIIVTVVLGCAGMCIFKPWRKDLYENYSIAGMIVILILILSMSVLPGAMLAYLIGSGAPTTYVSREEYKMVALTNKTAISGSFFLGAGTIHGESQFFFAYYSDKESGKIEFFQVSPYFCQVYEEKREDAIMKVMYKEVADPAWNLWIVKGSSHPVMEFHVPEGTIAYEIDFMGIKQSK